MSKIPMTLEKPCFFYLPQMSKVQACSNPVSEVINVQYPLIACACVDIRPIPDNPYALKVLPLFILGRLSHLHLTLAPASMARYHDCDHFNACVAYCRHTLLAHNTCACENAGALELIHKCAILLQIVR